MAQIQLIKGDGQARVQGQIPRYIFEKIFHNYLSAQERSIENFTHSYRIGDQIINLRFSNRVLVPFIVPALAHLKIPETSNPDLQICVWDYAQGGPLPNSLWKHKSFENTVQDARLLYLLDYKKKLGLFWVSKPTLIPYYEIGAPLRTIFHWWFQPRGFQILHSGAIGNANGCLLIVGKGGSGKSSTTLACLETDFKYLGDDYCMVKIDGTPEVFSLYNTLKLNWDNVNNFSDLPEPLKNTSGVQLEKAIFYIDQYKPNSISRTLPLMAIMVPQITKGAETNIMKTSSRNTLTALAPSTVMQLAGNSKASFENVRRLTENTPNYSLELGNDYYEIPDKLKKFMVNG